MTVPDLVSPDSISAFKPSPHAYQGVLPRNFFLTSALVFLDWLLLSLSHIIMSQVIFLEAIYSYVKRSLKQEFLAQSHSSQTCSEGSSESSKVFPKVG